VDATSIDLVNDDGATTCLNPLGVSPSEVSSESESEDDLSFEELASGFDKLRHAYNALKLKHDMLQRDHDALLSKFDDVCNDKMIIIHANEKLKIDNDALSSKLDSISLEKENVSFESNVTKNELASLKSHVCSSSNNAMLSVELNDVKDRIDCLSSTLNVCVHKHKDLMNLCVEKNYSIHKKNTHHAFIYAKVLKCKICGRNGHVAKYCFDAKKDFQKPISMSPLASYHVSMPRKHSHAPIEHHKHDVVYSCDLCGRKGHLAKYCFDAKRICVEKKNSLKKSFKSPHIYVPKKSFSAPFYTHTTSTHSFHCSYCGRNGHVKEFCFDRSKAINAPRWVHNPKAFDFTSRGNVPNSFGPKRFWVPK
jgi:hypothetical protein